jgi:hypothetical protein
VVEDIVVNRGGNTIMKKSTYIDAVLTARWLRMSPDVVWATIKGMMSPGISN